MRLKFWIFSPLFCGCLTLQAAASAEDPPIFESHIQPILSQRCGKCHGDGATKGELDLSSMQGIRRGGESGEPAVGASLEESPLWTMIDSGDMPPEGEPRLRGEEQSLIHEWIVAGARSHTPHDADAKTVTQHDVIPIMLLRCTTCHGARLTQGGVDLRTPAAMRKGGTNGPAIVPGDPDGSLVIRRIESESCPPRQSLLKFFVRRPPRSEVALLRDWIAAGAPEFEMNPDVAGTEPDTLVSNEDRSHWAFQPPRRSPGVDTVDEFVSRRLREADLDFASEADRNTLIRRAYLDLIGLPPAPDEWQHWLDSDDPQWFELMVDHLLASPHYGERWGRYWLDVAGYADSEGGVSADPIRPNAWKYRDYVIRAFNDDKPYDRFLLEQIAGDELVDHEQAPSITGEIVDNLVATGFLRMSIDQTGSRTMNFVPERLGVISDAMAVLGSGVMGLTIECARCHSHKYDPIPHRDYYRFKAIFQGAYDQHDWLTFKTRTLQVGTTEHRQRVADVNPPILKTLKSLQTQLQLATDAWRLELLRAHYPDQPDDDRRKTLAALKIADNNRTQPQRLLVEMLQTAELLPDKEQPPAVLDAGRRISDLEDQILQRRRQLEPEVTIRALWDRGSPSPTYILRRGDHDRPGRLVGPGVPSVLTDGKTPFVVTPPFPEGTATTGRRLAFARWLTRPDHPTTARVMVNRLWYHHFGIGLVQSLENFGVKGARPSHPELLDWLAVEFAQRGWSVKAMHRLMMNSRTYRQSSRISEHSRQRDPQNRLLSRMPLKRLDAEALRDSLLLVSGLLDTTAGGPPDPVSVNRDGLVTVVATPEGHWRRSIYAQHRRTEIPSLLDTFDYPEMGPNCIQRNVSTVSPQSLMLLNNDHVRRLAAALAGRASAFVAADHDDSAYVGAVYRLALSRNPTAEETRLGVESLQALEQGWRGDSDAAREAYCHTILNTAAFLYVD